MQSNAFTKVRMSGTAGLVLVALAQALAAAEDHGNGPFAVPTFHCLGLYWSPPGGAAGKEVQVRYRRQGTDAWKAGLAMRYNPIPGTDEDLTDYRGSIVQTSERTSAVRRRCVLASRSSPSVQHVIDARTVSCGATNRHATAA